MSHSFEEEVRLLSMVKILEPLSQEQLEELIDRYPDIHLEKGQHLYTPNYRSERLYMLKQGRVRIYRVADGRALTLARVDDGTMFGEMAMTDQHLRGAYAEAVEPSVVLALDR